MAGDDYMPTKDPKIWAATIVGGLLAGSGGMAGTQFLWPEHDHPMVEHVHSLDQYRLSQIEERLDKVESKTGELPPPQWRDKIYRLEQDIIRLQRQSFSEKPPFP